jgi:cyclic pyranopterin phosphate synthase
MIRCLISVRVWCAGPVLITAIIAGTMAVKQTSSLIPFCHPLPLDNCRILIDFVARPHEHGSHALVVECTVDCTAKTGVEMEALTGASVAALTIYDMLKAMSHDMVITDTRLRLKTGGKSDYNTAPRTHD